MEERTAEQWSAFLGFTGMILDPDGFDRSNWKYAWTEELMCENVYRQRLSQCTVSGRKIYEYLKVSDGT